MNSNHKHDQHYEQSEVFLTTLTCPICQHPHSEDAECPNERARYVVRLQTALPLELLSLPQFVCFKLLPGSPKQKKPPFNPATGELASPTDPKSWSSFEQATQAFLKNQEYAGIGFVFTANDPFTGIDLDGCRNPVTGEIVSWAQEIIDSLASLTEISLSSQGLHTLIKASKPGPYCKQGGIEIYDHARFFTLTGNLLPNTTKEILPRQEELDLLYQQVFVARTTFSAGKNTETNTETNTVGGVVAAQVRPP